MLAQKTQRVLNGSYYARQLLEAVCKPNDDGRALALADVDQAFLEVFQVHRQARVLRDRELQLERTRGLFERAVKALLGV